MGEVPQSRLKAAARAVGRAAWTLAKFSAKWGWKGIKLVAFIVAVPFVVIGGVLYSATGLDLRVARRRWKKQDKWRETAMAAPVRYGAPERVREGWARLNEVAESKGVAVDVSGHVSDGYEHWDLDGQMEGVAVPDSGMIGLSPELDLPRKTVVLAHELAHLSDPKVRSQRAGANHAQQPDKEVVAELAAHVVCSAYGIDTSERSWKYIEGWAARAPGGKQTLGRGGEEVVARAHAVVMELLPAGHRLAHRQVTADAFNRFIRPPNF